MHRDQESDMEERGMESGGNMMSSCSRPLLDRRLKPQAEQDLKCPRCDSTNTKFCYYNNYSLTQPRHFCKTCRRYWTKGGTLRSVPVGGGCRKNSKRGNNGSSNNNSNNNSKRSGDQPCSTSTEGTGTEIMSPSIGGASSNNYGYYNEAEELGMNSYGNSAYVADMGQSSHNNLMGFQSCLPTNLTNLQSLHYSGSSSFMGDHGFSRPPANRGLGAMNVGDLTSMIDTKHMTATSFDGDACNPYMNHHNLSADQSHSRLLLQQHQHQQQKNIYEEPPPQALYEAGYLWPDLSAYGLPNVNNSM